MEDQEKNETQLSLSKQRKIARKKEIAQMKRHAKMSKVVMISVISLLCIGIAVLIGFSVYRNSFKVTASSDFSAYLSDNGFIKDVTATSLVDLGDYKNIKVPASEVEYTDEEMNTDITNTLESFAELNKETDAAIADGDKVNIDYVGTIDNVEFEGGNTQGKGTDLTIGQNQYIDDFEQQLIGHKIGDKVAVNVTFPEDYSNDPTKAGKDATFEVVINGIYVAPELTDELVKKSMGENASTVNEYKDWLKQKKYDEKLATWLEGNITSLVTVSSYPEDYANHLKSTQKYEAYESFHSMNAYFKESLGYEPYKSFEEYMKMSEFEFDKSLIKSSKDAAKTDLIYQAILESEGLTVSEDDYLAYLQSQNKTKSAEDIKKDYDSEVTQYGKGYVLKKLIKIKALDKLKTFVTVE